jgi:purine-cytosine permease-like protein
MILSDMKRNVINACGTAMQLKLTPLKIRKIQRIFALTLLIVVVLGTFSSWSEFRFPTPNEQARVG